METSALTQGLERVPAQAGYLVISDGAVLASSGDLENDERTATVLQGLVATALGLRLPRGHHPPFRRLSGQCHLLGSPGVTTGSPWGHHPPFRRLSVVFGEHSLLVTVSGQKLFVVKRHNHVQDPVAV
ncbi:ragulator complex protein LAMTOR4 isoform X2 [Myiozetetes cayanensis]|uniref:ragulator complex protein LAMTOR4 isoform X2 n=1 Tax=Myiozetetes cayanensis TaxID=478635 RepID=UPI00215F68FE|nr:ragulator complex protein LAMTOR4 isoform X2 [Myiozetetes cayanensis]